ncbi:patatin-like phospholipase family protein [Lysobacter humi (ex Lee et al. 2017)]
MPQPGERIALVLGAAGARGMAQIGAIEAIEARGLRIAAIAGASSGALIGGFHAAGRLAAFRDWITGLSRVDMLRLLDSGRGHGGLIEGRDLMQALHALLGDVRMETLPIDLTLVAVDMLRQREVWLREGDLLQAIRASIAIPGLLAPQVVHGRELVDGGLLAPLPIAATRLSDAHRLVAIDMHGWPQLAPTELSLPSHPHGPGETDVSIDGAGDFWRVAPDDLGAIERVSRAFDIMQAQVARVQLALDPVELVIRIPRDACMFYEFWRAAEMIELGRVQADRALDAAGY